jgi:hypothetical protein
MKADVVKDFTWTHGKVGEKMVDHSKDERTILI